VHSEEFTLYTDPGSGSEIKLGGLSGLVPAGPAGSRLFHVITDRGPIIDGPTGGKAFTVPGFSPSILTVQLKSDGRARIVRVLPLRKPDGSPISGVPSACNTSEEPILDLNGDALERDPDGLDVEGLTRGPFGTFWICEEYLPSVALVGHDGRVLLRLVPRGAICGGEKIPTLDVLPEQLTRRIPNRGFEGIALTPAGKLYAVVQRPLANRATSEASRNIRVVEMDLRKLFLGRPGAIRQLLYLTEGKANRSILLSDLYAIDSDVLLVTERRVDKVFSIRISTATDISGLEDEEGRLLTPYQPDPTLPPKTTIEQLTESELLALGVSTLRKAEVFSGLTALDPALDKVEGLAVMGDQLVVCADNDFNLVGGDFATKPASIIFQSPPNYSRIFTIPLTSIPKP
jgi:hypothetical protein